MQPRYIQIFVVITIVFLFGCRPGAEKKGTPKTSTDLAKKGQATSTINKDSTSSDHSDSLQLISMMRDIMKYADRHKNEGSYTKELKVWDSPGKWAKLTFGNLFDGAKKHLIVRRAVSNQITNVDVFLLQNGIFNRVCTDTLISPSYLGDTVKDVNGDQQRDFLIEWSSPSGCCRRNSYDVYLYRPDKGDFSKQYQFINPTFSPSEKLIRGVTYGYHCALYKYKWNGAKVDTLEFIAADTLKKRFLVFKHEDDVDNYYDEDADNKKPGRVIAKIPAEFKKIDDFDWFEMSLDYKRKE